MTLIDLIGLTVLMQVGELTEYRRVHYERKLCSYQVIVAAPDSVIELDAAITEPSICNESLISFGGIFPTRAAMITSLIRGAHASDVDDFDNWQKGQVQALASPFGSGKLMRIGSTTLLKYKGKHFSVYRRMSNYSDINKPHIEIANKCDIGDVAIKPVYNDSLRRYARQKVLLRFYCQSRVSPIDFVSLIETLKANGIAFEIIARLDDYFGLHGNFDPTCQFCFAPIPETSAQYKNNFLFRVEWEP